MSLEQRIKGDAKLETYIYKKGGFRSQLRFRTADGRQGDIYKSAGQLRLSFDGKPTTRVRVSERKYVRGAMKAAVWDALGNPVPEPGK